jgi:aspartate kinase
MLATSEVSVSLTVDNGRRLPDIILELEAFAEVSVEEGLAIVCLVGDNLRGSTGAMARAFTALNGIKPRVVSQGASELNISMVVPDIELERAVGLLHGEFFATPDPEVFA